MPRILSYLYRKQIFYIVQPSFIYMRQFAIDFSIGNKNYVDPVWCVQYT